VEVEGKSEKEMANSDGDACFWPRKLDKQYFLGMLIFSQLVLHAVDYIFYGYC
jgi:hypothetical protein